MHCGLWLLLEIWNVLHWMKICPSAAVYWYCAYWLAAMDTCEVLWVSMVPKACEVLWVHSWCCCDALLCLEILILCGATDFMWCSWILAGVFFSWVWQILARAKFETAAVLWRFVGELNRGYLFTAAWFLLESWTEDIFSLQRGSCWRVEQRISFHCSVVLAMNTKQNYKHKHKKKLKQHTNIKQW